MTLSLSALALSRSHARSLARSLTRLLTLCVALSLPRSLSVCLFECKTMPSTLVRTLVRSFARSLGSCAVRARCVPTYDVHCFLLFCCVCFFWGCRRCDLFSVVQSSTEFVTGNVACVCRRQCPSVCVVCELTVDCCNSDLCLRSSVLESNQLNE